MVRTPDGATNREVTLSLRVTPTMRARIDEQRRARGGLSLSAYIRWLVAQDQKHIAQETARTSAVTGEEGA